MRNLREHDRAMAVDASGSPFNIVREFAVTNFSRDEIARLYAQYTSETGQWFSEAAVDLVWEQTRVQPLLVNQLAGTAVLQFVPDLVRTIEASHIEAALRLFEASNPPHLASLSTHRG